MDESERIQRVEAIMWAVFRDGDFPGDPPVVVMPQRSEVEAYMRHSFGPHDWFVREVPVRLAFENHVDPTRTPTMAWLDGEASRVD